MGIAHCAESIMQKEDHGAGSGQLFPAYSNTLVRWTLAVSGFTAATITAFAWYGYRSDWWQGQNLAPDQPVLFSHHHHTTELGIDCRYCHGSVETSSFAGMPATETCLSCHSGVFTDSPMLAPVIASARDRKPLEWNRVYDLADYVYFDHSVHVTNGIGCTTCHGDIGSQHLTLKAQPLYMSWCLECHRDPEKYVRRPEDVFSPSAPAISPLPLKQRRELVERFHVGGKHLTDCTTCHR